MGFADDFGKIPEARWLRAATFERLVRDDKFASEVATTTVGRLGLDRPQSVVIKSGHNRPADTADVLSAAHERAVAHGSATMIYQLGLPFVGFEEDAGATPVLPDFAVVMRKRKSEVGGDAGSWLIMGDAKDYERVRSKIDDGRLLKGFLQVALGAESAAGWSKLPAGMDVHQYGVLAVPRNAFLQPEALVEDISDHRSEVKMRVAERREESDGLALGVDDDIADFVAHLEATFDPARCTTCTLFAYCRNELRHSDRPTDLLVELGVAADVRPHAAGLVDDHSQVGPVPRSLEAMIVASREGIAQRTGQRRLDPVGRPGTINVVVAKSDSAALGVLGISTQRITAKGPTDWTSTVFSNPLGPETRRSIMKVLGREVSDAIAEQRSTNPESHDPVHIVVPERATADILVSIADNLAGIEISRLRWQRDKEMGRPPLTFNGEPAIVPPALRELQRTAVSFLLEEDRARTLQVRSPIVDVRAALARLVVPGGPAVSAFRLDYLVVWARAEADNPLDHRAIADEVEESIHTPGARLTSRRSDAIHRAYMGDAGGEDRPAEPAKYEQLILDELAYKQQVLDDAREVLDEFPQSAVGELHRRAEANAQAVWYRRLTFHASDLVRFGRTTRPWRRELVPVVESDDKVAKQLAIIANPQVALDAAQDAGNRNVTFASVVAVDPVVVEVQSRQVADESRIVLLHVNGVPCVEGEDVTIDKGKVMGLSIGPLSVGDHEAPRRFDWKPAREPELEVGDQLVIADFTWFCDLKRNTHLAIEFPKVDASRAPQKSCEVDSFSSDPPGHQWCCRPHEDMEAEWSDALAEKRKNGELNPQAWPPIVDADSFEVSPAGAEQGDPGAATPEPVPEGLTIDDID
ncbi:hypothetical protein [Aeromicrobium wangtongii]|uniref:Uncharacterized protein n=1 Tax=Aeromicrobium wangtongii TaxID=2969247 RepID=A0ABY5M2E0_9ACTN|nr:hypothetical protein [Aeromicrobium wangtongii]MCD9198332.1 hypothetical protein [Aeromicrobium wangtongii]UUP12364.1 hypothetical protein NQV15_10905 [Aeromicrobium wangtongii]